MDSRLLQLSFFDSSNSSLGFADFVPISVQGGEGYGVPLYYEVTFVCFCLNTDTDLTSKNFINQFALLTISQADYADKRVYGLVTQCQRTIPLASLNPIDPSSTSSFSSLETMVFTVTIESPFAILKTSNDYRVYQQLSLKAIIALVFKHCHAGLCDLSLLTQSYPNIPYCVQYNESYFDFIVRLCEQYGVYYYSEIREQEDGQCVHVTVFEDQGYGTGDAGELKITYRPQADTVAGVTHFVEQHNDIEVAKAQYFIARTTRHDLVPGKLFTLSDHTVTASNQAYAVISSHYTAIDYSEQGQLKLDQLLGPEHKSAHTQCTCEVVLLPDDQRFRLQQHTAIPCASYETALVTGPENKELYTNDLHQVRLIYPWDRYGKQDDTSSCWIPVAQRLSGETHATQFLPRVGDQLVVNYLDGKPDQPIVKGSLFSAEHLPPFEPEKFPYKTGIKTKTIDATDPDQGHYWCFDTDPNNPSLAIQSQGDYYATVGGDLTRTVYGSADMTVEHGNLTDNTTGVLTIIADEEIRLSCGDSTIVLDQDGLHTQGGNLTLQPTTPVIPPFPAGHPVQVMHDTLSVANQINSLVNPYHIVDIVYAPGERKFYPVSQEISDKITKMEEQINAPMQALYEKLKSSAKEGYEDTAQRLKELRQQVCQAVLDITNKNIEFFCEIIHLGKKQAWGYIHKNILADCLYVVDGLSINFTETTSAIIDAIKAKVKDVAEERLLFNIADFQYDVDGSFGAWAKSINEKPAASLFSSDHFDVTGAAQLMRYTLKTSLTSDFSLLDKGHLNISGDLDSDVTLFDGKLVSNCYFPKGKQGKRFEFTDGQGKNLDLGLFQANFILTLMGYAGASLQLGGDMNLSLLGNTTKITPRFDLNEAAEFFAGVKMGCDLDGCLYWANPEDMKPPTNQSKEYEHITDEGDLTKVPLKKVAEISGGAEAAAGVGLGERFKINYVDGVFYLVISVEAVVAVGFSGRFSCKINKDTIVEFFIFLYHQIKNNNYHYTGLFMDVAYNAWVGLKTVSAWVGKTIIDLARHGLKDVKAWIYSLQNNADQLAEYQQELIENLNKNPDNIYYAPPETKGHWLYYLCQQPVFSKTYWEQAFFSRQDAIQLILNSIQSDNEYGTVMEHILPIAPEYLEQRPKKIQRTSGELLLWQTEGSVMYIGNIIRHELENIKQGLDMSLNQKANEIYNNLSYRTIAYRNFGTTQL